MIPRFWSNGERRLTLAIAIFVLALTGAVVFVGWQVLTREPPDIEVTRQEPLPASVAPGESVVMSFEVCNRTGEEGRALIFVGWISTDERTEADMPVVTLAAQESFPPGCNVVSQPRQTVPRQAGHWRRVGFAAVSFEEHQSALLSLESEEVEVQGP